VTSSGIKGDSPDAPNAVQQHTMSLAKIPFIIASAISVHISFFSAAPPPKDEEKMAPNVFESFVLLFQKLWGNDIKKVCRLHISVVDMDC